MMKKNEVADAALGPLRVRRFDCDEGMLPFRLEAFHPQTGEVVWSVEVTAPGPVHIPALRRQLGHPVAIALIDSKGNRTEMGPQLPGPVQ